MAGTAVPRATDNGVAEHNSSAMPQTIGRYLREDFRPVRQPALDGRPPAAPKG